jgi:hypothetical protein
MHAFLARSLKMFEGANLVNQGTSRVGLCVMPYRKACELNYYRLTAVSQTPAEHPLGSEYRDRHPSRASGNSDMRPWPSFYLPRVGSSP